jgi:hypothetical protein
MMPKNLSKLKVFCDFIINYGVELTLTWYWEKTRFCWSGADDTMKREQEMQTEFWFENF